MLVKKTKEQREYLLKLKSEVSDYLLNYKKRYQLFPWNKVNKIAKLQMNSKTPINVNGTDFTVKKLVKEIDTIKAKIQSRMRPSYYNYILKAYIKDSMNKQGKPLKDVYHQYKEELQGVFKEMKLDLMFCLEGLKQLNKTLKSEKTVTKSIIKESEDYNMFDIVDFDGKYTKEEVTQFLISCYEAELADNEEELMTEGANLEARAIFKKFKQTYRQELKDIKNFMKENKYKEAKKSAESLLSLLGKVKKELMAIEGGTLSAVIGLFTAWTVDFLRNFLIALVPYVGSFAAGIKGMIEAWSKPAKKIMNHEDLKSDDFNAYKNVIESRISAMEKMIQRLINKINENEAAYKKGEEIKESTDIDSMTFVNESGETEDIRQFVLSVYESMEDLDDDFVTEGTNLDIRASLKKFKKTYKTEMSKIKVYIKENKYDQAKKCCQKLLDILKDTEKEVSMTDSTTASVVFGFFTSWTLSFMRSFALCLIPAFGPVLADVMQLIEAWSKPAKKLIDGEGVTKDDLNAYKNTVESKIKSMETIIKNTMKKIDSMKKDFNKAEKEVKESTEFDTEKKAIYEACSKGEITLEEREELLQNLKDRQYLSEAYTDDEVLLEEEGLSNKEKFEKVRSVLYERCSKGELTVEQRESLIMKAKDMIFAEASSDKPVNVDKVMGEVSKETEKEDKTEDQSE